MLYVIMNYIQPIIPVALMMYILVNVSFAKTINIKLLLT